MQSSAANIDNFQSSSAQRPAAAAAAAAAPYAGAGSASGYATCHYREYEKIANFIVVGDKVKSRDTAPPSASVSLWRGQGHQVQPLRVQTPVLRLPYGLSDNTRFLKKDATGKFTEKVKHTLDMSLKDWETKPDINAWVEFVWAVEGAVVETAKKNRATWFKPPVVGIGRGGSAANSAPATVSDDVILSHFKSSIHFCPPDKKNKDGQPANYPPTFKSKCRYNRGNLITTFWSDIIDPATGKPTKLTADHARTKGILQTSMIEVGPVWFMPTEDFGVTWLVNQTKILTTQDGNSQEVTETYAFDDADAAYTFATGTEATAPAVPAADGVDTDAMNLV